jgi:hypothetical protein
MTACGSRFSDRIVIDVREVSDFDKVSISSIGTLIITQGDKEELKIEGQQYITQRILTTVRNQILTIEYSGSLFGDAIPTEPIIYRLTVDNLSGLHLAGAANIRVSHLETERLEIRVTGVGAVTIDALTTEELDVDLSGAGSVRVVGQAENQSLLLSSVGEYDASNFACKHSKINLTGAGVATVWAQETLDVKLSGIGSVEYYGTPVVTSKVTGLGRLMELGVR